MHHVINVELREAIVDCLPEVTKHPLGFINAQYVFLSCSQSYALGVPRKYQSSV
jgi:hypothetical protein